MIIYFLLFLIPAIFAINNQLKVSTFFWFVLGIIFTVAIGLRHEVGGDWGNYLNNFNKMQYYDFYSTFFLDDPGYKVLSYIIYHTDFGIYGVNFVCAIFFTYGLIKLIKDDFNPWLALTVAVPYTITVVAMGYTRQAVALGFAMWAITYLRKNNLLAFSILILFAVTFHKSAVLLIGLGIFSSGGGNFLKIIAVISIGIGLYFTFLASHADALIQGYVQANMKSSGAFIRTFMNLIPAILLILYRKKWQEYFNDFKFWFIISILSIISFAMVGVASTAVDRMALYLLPIQFIVFSRLSLLMAHQFNQSYVNLSIVAYSGLVLYVWLNFAVNSYAWINYKNLLFLNLW